MWNNNYNYFYNIFVNDKTGESREIFFHMNDEKVYMGESGKEKGWRREFVSPNASIDSNIDPFDKNKFLEKTKVEGDTMGSILDRSKELSEKRAKLSGTGRDPVKDKYMDNWSARRGGKKFVGDDRPGKPVKLTTKKNNK